MMDLVLLGAVIAGTYFFLKAVWNYQLRVAQEIRK